MDRPVQLEATAPPESAPGCGPAVSAAGLPLRRQVFERVRAAGAIPRIDLSKELGVSPASVTAMAAELIEAGLIREVASPRREGDPARGRPPVALGVRPEAGCVAGLKLSDHAHTAVVMDFAGGLLAEASLARSALRRGADAVLAETQTVLDAALAQAGLARGALSAVGLGLPGAIRNRDGVVAWSPIISEREARFGPALADRLGVPVAIDNDANLLTLAELWFGAGRGRSDFAVVTIERGVGMGLVLDNRLWRGAGGLGMELGHSKVQLDGALCRCGQRGCLEAYVADYAVVREASTALDWEHRSAQSTQALLSALVEQARAGDAAARAIFHRAGRFLALGLANVATLFDPPLIILSGARMRHEYLYAEEVFADMAAMTLDVGRPPPRIEVHAWGDFAWARGAAAMALDMATAAALGPAAEHAA